MTIPETSNQKNPNPLQNPLPPQGIVTIEDKAEKVAQDLQINLPGRGLFLPLRIIALFTLIGGMSLIGSMFADILDPSRTNFGFYIERLMLCSKK